MSNLDQHTSDLAAHEIQREYRYGPGWLWLIFGPPLLAGVTVACAVTAMYLDRDVLLWRLILVPAILMRLLAAGAAIAAAFGVFSTLRDLFRRLTTRQRLALTANGVIVPDGRRGEKVIPYAAMTKIGLVRATDTQELVALEIESTAGGFTVQRAMLPKGALDEFRDAIQAEFERHHQPEVLRHREAFWEAEQQREQKYADVTAGTRQAAAARAKEHQVMALSFGEAEPKIVAVFETDEKAAEYAKFLGASQQYQWVRVEKRMPRGTIG
jgi:hypothetical protein